MSHSPKFLLIKFSTFVEQFLYENHILVLFLSRFSILVSEQQGLRVNL